MGASKACSFLKQTRLSDSFMVYLGFLEGFLVVNGWDSDFQWFLTKQVPFRG